MSTEDVPSSESFRDIAAARDVLVGKHLSRSEEFRRRRGEAGRNEALAVSFLVFFSFWCQVICTVRDEEAASKC